MLEIEITILVISVFILILLLVGLVFLIIFMKKISKFTNKVHKALDSLTAHTSKIKSSFKLISTMFSWINGFKNHKNAKSKKNECRFSKCKSKKGEEE